jgi:hypothetical protein
MSLATISAKAGLVLRDFGETFQARVAGDSATSRFTLARDNVELDSVYIERQAGGTTNLTPTESAPNSTQYVLDKRYGVITLGLPLPTGDWLVANGKAYVATLPTDISSYIDTAFNLHATGRHPAVTVDDLSPTEEYLVAILAVIEALWALATEASQDIDVMTPEGVNIPASQRFAQILTLIQSLQEHYKELAQAFNVGPYRIMVSTLRRISRTTNRYVPIYVGQEFDDRTYPPTRVYPPIDSGLMEIEE